MDRTLRRTIACIPAALILACATSPSEQDTTTLPDSVPDTADTTGDGIPGDTSDPDSHPTDTGGDDAGDPTGEDAACPPGETLCGETCVDLSSDTSHCGLCDRECTAEGENMEVHCISGECSSSCLDGYWDLDGAPGCEYPCTFVSGSEACNGVDDNCDGNVEEGFPCMFGDEVTCTTTCGSIGSGTCGLACTLPVGEECTPPDEICNELDDDCDTLVDEDFAPGTCGTCVPDCTGRDCGLDPVCYTSCGSCDPATEICNASGICECVPDCLGRDCGDNGCGGSCGTCPTGQICDSSGHCVTSCTPDCTGRVCGDDGCGGTCGTCTPPDTCDAFGQCITPCVPDCAGRDCGDDGCGGSCGTCPSGEICDSSGLCTATCSETPCGLVPNCGCPAPLKCSLINSGGTLTRSCVPAGTGVKGSSCASDSDCAAGFLCVILQSDEGNTDAACYPFCDSDADCPGDASVCWAAFSGTTDSICTLGCNLVTNDGCPVGSKCQLYTITSTSEDMTDCSSDVGVGTAGAYCTLESDCAPGHFCGHASGIDECIPYCTDSPVDTCTTVMGGCTPFTSSSTGWSLVFDGYVYGYCY